MRLRVKLRLRDTPDIREPISRFIKVDLPEFGGPRKAAVRNREFGGELMES